MPEEEKAPVEPVVEKPPVENPSTEQLPETPPETPSEEPKPPSQEEILKQINESVGKLSDTVGKQGELIQGLYTQKKPEGEAEKKDYTLEELRQFDAKIESGDMDA